MSSLTTAQAATALGVNASRVRQLILAGRIRAEKRGRDWLVESDSLAEYERMKSGRKPKAGGDDSRQQGKGGE